MELQGILVDQQKDLAESRQKWIRRDAQTEFDRMRKSSLIKVVMGIRRSGKSTLCAQAATDDELAYCNFDDERLASVTANELNAVYETLLQLKPNAKVFFFDEIQNVDRWELFVNRLKRKGLDLLITGSNGKLLSQELATHLTGRHLEIELLPFSFAEHLRAHDVEPPAEPSLASTEERAALKRQFQTYFERGGFPEVVRGEPPGPYLRELFDKIVSRDIAQRHEVRTPRLLKQLALYLMQQSGSLTSLKKLLATFQYRSVNTLRAHIGFLEDAFLLHAVPAYSFKVRERSTSIRKHYACDTGMMAALSAKPTPDWGLRFETLVFLQLRRRCREVTYVKGPDHDVDFAVTADRELTELVQACYDLGAPATLDREITSLVRAAKKYPRARLRLVTLHDERVVEVGGHRVEIVPAWRFCLQQ